MAVAVVAALALVGVGPTTGLARPALPGLPMLSARAHATYFAGRSYPEAGAASITTEFLLPRLTCTSMNSGVAAGAFLYTSGGSSNHDPGRTVLSGASVQLFCLHGEPAPLPVVEFKGRQRYGSIRPHSGDLMRATVVDSDGLLTVALEDLTKGHTFSLTRSTTAAPASAAVIGDDALRGVPSLTRRPVYPITNFGSIHFTAGRVNGAPLGAAGGRAFDMVARSGQLQIRTGRLTGRRPQESFTTRWKHS